MTTGKLESGKRGERPIIAFQGAYRFLSNFWPCRVKWGTEYYRSVEHAYQAAKTGSPIEQTRVQDCVTAGDAKRMGRKVTLRPDWDLDKLAVMLDLVRQKFQDPMLQRQLLFTGNAELIEGNYWHDTFWGVCNGEGENHLGKILMQVRNELQERKP
jgi:ribA/ribD-fused uncharacterized protein